MTVNPQWFADAMADHFSERGITVSAQHKDAFRLFAETLNRQLSETEKGLDILAFPTGAGKTTALELFASMTSATMLIATRRKLEADDIAKHINELAGKTVAQAVHSSGGCASDEADIRVRVVTHEGYKKIIRKETPTHAERGLIRGQRFQLHVIDESLNIFYAPEISMTQIDMAMASISPIARKKYPQDVKRLEQIVRRLKKSNGILRPSDWNITEVGKNKAVQSGMFGTLLDHELVGRNDTELRGELFAQRVKILKTLDMIPKCACNVTRTKGSIKISVAGMALPFQRMKAVILDATANWNIQYRLLGKETARVIQPPEGIRSYRNVTLYVSMGHKLGKDHLAKITSDGISKVIEGLPAALHQAKKFLICTHKKLVPMLQGYDNLPDYKVVNYGAIDGRNDWQDHDAILIFGLPYMPPRCLEAQVVATEEYRNLKLKRKKAVVALGMSHLRTSVIQAINRVRCRSVTRNGGNCEPVSVCLFLPEGKTTEAIMEAIKAEMPDIQIVEMHSELLKRKAKGSKSAPKLISFFMGEPTGSRYSRGDLMKKLRISKSTMERLISQIKDTASSLYIELSKIGVYLQPPLLNGRGYELIFEKRAVIQNERDG